MPDCTALTAHSLDQITYLYSLFTVWGTQYWNSWAQKVCYWKQDKTAWMSRLICSWLHWSHIWASTRWTYNNLCSQWRLRSTCVSVKADQSLLIAYAFYSLQAIQRGINENPSHTGWLYKLIWVFAGHTGLLVCAGSYIIWLSPDLQASLDFREIFIAQD